MIINFTIFLLSFRSLRRIHEIGITEVHHQQLSELVSLIIILLYVYLINFYLSISMHFILIHATTTLGSFQSTSELQLEGLSHRLCIHQLRNSYFLIYAKLILLFQSTSNESMQQLMGSLQSILKYNFNGYHIDYNFTC